QNSYPDPDPAWDYNQPFKCLQETKEEIETLISFMSKHEEASPSADAWIRSAIANIIRDLEECLILFD
ncbi:MAG: hypothetical protein ACKPE3_30795, partial [Sphaerospermopsis kisseleviana]